ncbi:desmoglein-2 isoform X2 [Gallus gallus]|uniref:desmoglein-2 isoform X2 n=1 Tax=Gallus gallus TaxID=9031 RepID=UPI001AE72865|nr:desmoglein-2 isoform X2 [Gallus gallus]XP_040520322.1 desmoglein-2 isoform X2 [Gallus gallus]
MSRGSAAARLLALLICLSCGNGLHWKIHNRSGRSGTLFHPNSLVRQKREWTVPPAFIREEEDNSYRNPIARIHSDFEDTGIVVTYTISGQGVTEPPYGLFVINGKTGDLNITGRVDREKTPVLFLRGHALDRTGAKLEEPIDLPVRVLDINDNPPVFSHEVFVGSVEELSETGTIVMRLNATDADEPNNLNSKIAFKIISQSPSSAFSMNKDTGEVQVATINLDRETQSSYSLVVEGKDRGGAADGNGATCSVEIKILDVNDNLPVLESSAFEGSVEENRANVEILRIKVFDKDEEFSDNWLANFSFVSGNEGGYFRIVTDTRTNEGILTLVKALNYEEMQSLNLGIVVTNKAEFHKSIKSSYKAQTIPIRIHVIDVREGPVFPGGTKIIEASESVRVNQVIGQYQAIDEDTGKAAVHIKYIKGRDPANWIIINSNTAEIQLAKNLDYESSYVVNGTYTFTMLGVTTDLPTKTVTGTVVIHVQDENDNCPIIENPLQTVCSDARFVDVTAKDIDSYPYSAPYSFSVIDEPKGTAEKWIIASKNVIPLLLLLCPCGSGAKKGFATIPDCSEETLRKWNSEGAVPEEKSMQSVMLPTALGNLKGAAAITAAAAAAGMSAEEAAAGGSSSASNIRGQSNTITSEVWEEQRHLLPTTDYHTRSIATGRAEGMISGEGNVVTGGGVAVESTGAMNEEFLRDYFTDKAVSFAEEDEAQAARDCLLVYSQGESGSPHGSIGCCSFIEGDLDDHFLDDLGDKFKTLAEICIGRRIDMKDASSKNESSFGVNEQKAFSSKQASASGGYLSHAPSAQAGGAVGSEAVSQEVIMETTSSLQSGQHDARTLTTPFTETNVTVTETYSGGGPTCSAASFLDPQFKENIVVTERVLAPASGLREMVEIPSLLSGKNMVVTERMLTSEGPGVGTMAVQDLPNSKYVVVRERERVLVPSTEQGSLSFPTLSEGQSMVVNENDLTASAGPGRAEQVLITDSLLSQSGSAMEGAPPASSTLSKSSRVTQYSTVQYSRS